MTHPDEGRLNDYVDGQLGRTDAARLEAHLEGCAACSDRVEVLRDIADRLDALPRGIAPRRDLRPRAPGSDARRWSGRSGGASPVGETRDLPERRPGDARPWLRAAAAVAVLIGVGAGLWLGVAPGGEPGTPAPVAAGPEDPVIGAYARAVGELAGAVRARRAELSPEAVRALDANLAAVDAAIRELERARGEAAGRASRAGREIEVGREAGPGRDTGAGRDTEAGREAAAGRETDSAALDRHLEARYRTKLELLRSALELLEAS